MHSVTQHLWRCLVAGIVALLPIGGTVLTVAYLESSIAASGLSRQPWYFPGCGLLVAAVLIYLVGLVVSTFVGRWMWTKIDRLLDRLPALGRLYQTLKQILGYGEGKDAIFERVVLVPGRDVDAYEVGLVTNQVVDDSGAKMQLVFVPSAPTPTTGRLLMIDPTRLVPLDIPPSEALKALVSVGKVPLPAAKKSAG